MGNTYVIREIMDNEKCFESQDPPIWVARECSRGKILMVGGSESELLTTMKEKFPELTQEIEPVEVITRYCSSCEVECTDSDKCECGYIICRKCLFEYDHGRDGKHLVRYSFVPRMPANLVNKLVKLDINSYYEFVPKAILLLEEYQLAKKMGFKIMMEDLTGEEPEYTEIMK